MTRACTDCGRGLSDRNRSGRCVDCFPQWARSGQVQPIYGDPATHAEQSNRDMVRALRRYAEKHHPEAAWLKDVDNPPPSNSATCEVGA